jgi:hypothetical protein
VLTCVLCLRACVWCVAHAAAGADVNLADPNTGNAAQMAAAVGHLEVVEKLVEAGCAWPHGKKANTGLGAPVDVVQLLSQKTSIPVRGRGTEGSAGMPCLAAADAVHRDRWCPMSACDSLASL